MTSIIVSGADEAFAPLLFDLLQSIEDCPAQPFDAIGILDLGLSEASRERLRPKVARIVEPAWDIPIEAGMRAEKPHLRALTARPFLRDYFPGHETYLWIDSDAWVQDGFALDWFFHAAKLGGMGLATHIDRCYELPPNVTEWRSELLKASFADPGSELHVMQQYFNTGIFCLRADARHWAVWEKWLRTALEAVPHIVCDQTALNYAIWKEGLPVHPLPALANWCCHLAIPRLGPGGILCEPFIPRRKLGIVHLSAGTKDWVVEGELGGRRLGRSLRYGATPEPIDPAVG